MPEPKEVRWLCPSKTHVLGLIVQDNGRGNGLLLFREAMAIDGDITEADQFGLVYGEMTVCCSGCKQIRTWFPGELELENLLRMMRRK